jgi:adenosylcobinamide kinase/adenosylcobinamide-phosphate guanylyltransferase
MEYFVEAIDGIANDLAGDCGWHFEVNGYRCNVPAERYLLKDRDWVQWMYLGEPQAAPRHMASHVILITGAARSGKSSYAEARAAVLGPRRVYIATAEAKDEEMSRRIAEHKNRRGNSWATVEEPLDLSSALLAQQGRADCALVDCLTMWLSNLLLYRGAELAREQVEQVVKTLRRLDFPVVMVTNEVGWGIVPENALARQYRDLAGWANQRVAGAADEVVLTVAGIPMILKQATP